MKILAVEFSSEQRSVAVVEKGEDGLAQLRGSASETGRRTAHAFALVEKALHLAKMEREEIGCLAIGLGPGSYTGIRAALALAQGWQLACEVKVLGVSSVECLAAQTHAKGIRGTVNIIIDAQRNEFYLAAYEVSDAAQNEIEPLHLVTFTEVEKRVLEKQIVLGPEARQSFPHAQNLNPDAETLGRIAAGKTNFISAEKLEPIYLREVSFVKAPAPRIISEERGSDADD